MRLWVVQLGKVTRVFDDPDEAWNLYGYLNHKGALAVLWEL